METSASCISEINVLLDGDRLVATQATVRGEGTVFLRTWSLMLCSSKLYFAHGGILMEHDWDASMLRQFHAQGICIVAGQPMMVENQLVVNLRFFATR